MQPDVASRLSRAGGAYHKLSRLKVWKDKNTHIHPARLNLLSVTHMRETALKHAPIGVTCLVNVRHLA